MSLEVQSPRPETRRGGVREDQRASLISLISLVLLNRAPTVFFLDAFILAAARLRFSRRILSSTVLSEALSGLFILSHTNDYVTCFLSRVDISVRFGSLFQRISSVYHGSYFSRLNELFEKDEIFGLVRQRPAHDLL